MGLARELIDADADKVVRRLARHGHKAYLVGGCVRDLLLERTPKDFDVATSATPNEIKDLFRNCRIIGRRFRLAHVFFGPKIIETSTFRANPRQDEDGDEEDELLIRRDNVFGSETEDARRRDFTINGLFYDVEAETVIDHVGGMTDLQARLVRTIGDPEIRFREDPVRMLRAVKFAARLGFTIEPATHAALLHHRAEILKCAPPRVLEEVYRLLRGGAARRSMELLLETGLATFLSPQLASMFGGAAEPAPRLAVPEERAPAAPAAKAPAADTEEASWEATWRDEETPPPPPPAELDLTFVDEADELTRRRQLAWRVLDELDRFAGQGVQLSNAMLLAALASSFVADELIRAGTRANDANEILIELLQPLVEQLRVARRDAERARQLLLAQRRLAPSRRRRGRPNALARRDYFNEALAVYETCARAAGHDVSDLEQWRTVDEREDDQPGDGSRPRKKRRRRRGGRRRRRDGDSSSVGDGPGHDAAASG
jgi:poly(A) polymerase